MVNTPFAPKSRSKDAQEPSPSAVAPSASSTAAPPATSDNPVVATVQKAKNTIRRHVDRPALEQRPSVRLTGNPNSQPTTVDTSNQHNSRGGNGGWRSLWRRQPDTSGNNEKNGQGQEGQEGQEGRKPVMVPRQVADNLAPHIAAARAEGHDNPQALAEEMAANPQAYTKTGQQQGGFRSLINWVKGSDNGAYGSTVHAQNSDAYDSEMVDLLDVMDPQVSTLSTLTNVQNSLFIPQLGRMVNRQPAYHFSTEPEELQRLQRLKESLSELKFELKDRAKRKIRDLLGRPQPIRIPSISSQMNDYHYAVLNHGETLQGWSEEDKAWLDDLVRHSLHSRRAKIKRSLKGFGKYVRRPLGLFVTVYATLITLFGAAWVLFLIGWISIGSRKAYIVNVVDNILVALFAVMGDGLAPFRAVDTYHMVHIAWYYRKTIKLRRKLGLPDLVDPNDLPEQSNGEQNTDVEMNAGRPSLDRRSVGSFAGEYSVLSEAQQAKLQHHQRKFSKSHTFYKPHETATHYAFPLTLLFAIVILLDFHSMLQITLGACTWGISYKKRPFALTTVVLICSITCNITGGILIAIGDKRTRKHDVLELMMRRELTSEAIEKMQKIRLKEAEERGDIDRETRKQTEDQMEEAENEEIKGEWKRVHLLPKKLLGKSEDTREPALPRQHGRNRRRGDDLDGKGKTPEVPPDPATSHVQAPKPMAQKLSVTQRLGFASAPQQNIDVVDHAANAQPAPKTSRPAESKMNRAARMFRRADMDMS